MVTIHTTAITNLYVWLNHKNVINHRIYICSFFLGDLYFQSNDTDIALIGGITTIPAQKMSVFTT